MIEHILVPNLEETIKFIADRLSEQERESSTRFMKVKEIVREHYAGGNTSGAPGSCRAKEHSTDDPHRTRQGRDED